MMLGARTGAWAASGEKPIPYEQCDGVLGDGVAYFATSISPTSEDRYHISVDNSMAPSGWRAVFGSASTAYSDGVRFVTSVLVSLYGKSYQNGSFESTVRNDSMYASTRGVAEFDLYSDDGVARLDINGVAAASADMTHRSWTNGADSSNIYLLAYNNRGTVTQQFSGVIKKFEAYRSGNLILDLYPVVAPDGCGAFYDAIGNVLLERRNGEGNPRPWYQG